LKNRISPRLVHILAIGAYVLMIAVNAAATMLAINDVTTSEISDRYASLFTPAGITFSVWGLIYAALLVYTVYQTGSVWKHTPQQSKVVAHINWLYILSCLANAAWIVCWHYEKIALSLIVMLILLAILVVIYLRIHAMLRTGSSRSQKLCVLAPFSLYLGWITVAAIANVSALLVGIGWNGFGISQPVWTVVMMLLAVFVTLMVQRQYRDMIFTAVVIWALAGILIKHITVYKMAYTLILVAGVMSIAALLIGIVLIFSSKKRVRRKIRSVRSNRRRTR